MSLALSLDSKDKVPSSQKINTIESGTAGWQMAVHIYAWLRLWSGAAKEKYSRVDPYFMEYLNNADMTPSHCGLRMR